MSLAVSLHHAIEHYNVLKKPTEQINDYLSNHPTLRKVTLLVDHTFRLAMMVLDCSVPVKVGICFVGSLFYRLTVETHCAYKFALPAFGGFASYLIGKQALHDVISGVAFSSLQTLGSAFIALTPLTCYATYSILTVSYDVDH